MANMLQLKNVTVSYKNVPTVQNFNLDMKQGQIVSLVGESGSGKTTVIRAVLGLLAGGGVVSGGSITFEGKDLLSYNREEWRNLRGSEISMIFQDSGAMMNPTRKVGDVFVEYLRTHEKISKKDAWAKGCGMLEKMNLPSPDNVMKSYPFQLSGGQRQRVMIAMALVCKPEILIADEPTTALDVTIQAQILDLMNQLKKETGTSILFITHDLGVVAEVCDDVAVMYCGRVVERGDVKTIFANPSHPYTKGLLGSIPRLGDAGKELKSIPGNVPNPKYMPKGCKFEPRCPYASEKCREEEPGFFQIEEGHISRCWLCESGQLKTDHVEKAGD